LDTAINSLNSQRATIGAGINQMTYAADNAANIAANAAASRSTVLDTDYATASTQLAKGQIIQQAATAMLAQANQQPQSVLALLK
jgi:flagellin